MKKVFSRVLIFVFGLLFLCFCVVLIKSGIIISEGMNEDDKFSIAMVTDGGGVNDQSFQESAWRGLQKLSQGYDCKVRYVECQQTSDFLSSIDRLADEKTDLTLGIGYKLADYIKLATKINPERNYILADYSFGDSTPDNMICLVFRAEESSFLVGYIAGMSTKSDNVGFIGGMKSVVIDQFEYGFRAGVLYAAQKLGKNINIKVQYAETFTDSAKGKAVAIKMFDECDIVFHAAGGAGVGVIEAAKECDKFAIGVDMDQINLAPNNVLTSAVKDVGKAIETISVRAINGENLGGQTFSFGIKENCVGIPENNPNINNKILKLAKKIEQKISDKEIIPPSNLSEYNNFVNSVIKKGDLSE